MTTNVLTPERKSEIHSLISKTNREKEVDMIAAIARLNKGDYPEMYLQQEVLHLNELFAALNQIPPTCQDTLLNTLETVFCSYIRQHPQGAPEVFRTYSALTKLLLVLYKHGDLINDKEIQYEQLAFDVEKYSRQ